MAYRQTVAQRRLGAYLQRLRDRANLSQENLATLVNEGRKKPLMSSSYYSRLETGSAAIDRAQLDRIIEVLGVSNDDIGQLLMLHQKLDEPKWWHAYRDLLDDTAEQSIELAEEAAEIHAYESIFVQAFLQTADYTRALIDAEREFSGHIAAVKALEIRLKRQERLRSPDFLGLKVVLTEAAIRQQVGSRGIMREQLDRLCEVAEDGKIALHVIPYYRTPWLQMAGSQIYIFADNYMPDAVFIGDDLGSNLYEDVAKVRLAIYRFAVALTRALSARETIDLISAARAEL
jgi:transcriptional regulator with XRE-family HTH domain